MQVIDKAATDVTGRQTAKSALFRITRVAESLTATMTGPSPSTSASPIPIHLQFDRPVQSFGPQQIKASGAKLNRGSLTPSGAAGYDFEVMPRTQGRPHSDSTDVRVEIAAGSVSDDLDRTLADTVEFVTRFEPGPEDVVIEEDGEAYSSNYPGLDAADQETLRGGMEILNAVSEAPGTA